MNNTFENKPNEDIVEEFENYLERPLSIDYFELLNVFITWLKKSEWKSKEI